MPWGKLFALLATPCFVGLGWAMLFFATRPAPPAPAPKAEDPNLKTARSL